MPGMSGSKSSTDQRIQQRSTPHEVKVGMVTGVFPKNDYLFLELAMCQSGTRSTVELLTAEGNVMGLTPSFFG